MGELSVSPDDGGRLKRSSDSRAVDMAEVWTERLLAFRAGHDPRRMEIGGLVWPYLLGGRGERPLLLLHGSASDGESLFGLMAPLERSYRVVAPTYPNGAQTIAAVVNGLDGLLDALGITQALVVGYSLGGYVAQALAWRYPERVASLALLNTGAPAQGAARAAAVQNALLAALPSGLMRAGARAGAGAMLSLDAPGPDRGAAAFWSGYLGAMARRVGKDRMLAHGRLVVDFLSGSMGVAPGVGERPTPAALIVHSARDRTILPAERRALDMLYPQAARVMEPNAGHLSVPTRPEGYLAAIETVFPSPCATG